MFQRIMGVTYKMLADRFDKREATVGELSKSGAKLDAKRNTWIFPDGSEGVFVTSPQLLPPQLVFMAQSKRREASPERRPTRSRRAG
jgi:hypothetical protein